MQLVVFKILWFLVCTARNFSRDIIRYWNIPASVILVSFENKPERSRLIYFRNQAEIPLWSKCTLIATSIWTLSYSDCKQLLGFATISCYPLILVGDHIWGYANENGCKCHLLPVWVLQWDNRILVTYRHSHPRQLFRNNCTALEIKDKTTNSHRL